MISRSSTPQTGNGSPTPAIPICGSGRTSPASTNRSSRGHPARPWTRTTRPNGRERSNSSSTGTATRTRSSRPRDRLPRHPRHVERHRPNRRNGYDDHDACDRGSTIPPMGDVHGHVSGAGRRHCRPFHVQGVDLWRHERFENAQRQSGRRHQLRSDLPAHLRR